jgi:hypothetical protein
MSTGQRLRVLSGRFAVCRLAADAEIPAGLASGALLSITRTANELSIVCDERSAPPAARIERGWACLMVEGPLAFNAVGVLASITGPLAAAGVSIFSLSTFDTDYVLVSHEHLPRAIDALRAAGHAADP